MWMRVTYAYIGDEARYAKFYHMQTWMLPALTASFAFLIWISVSVSVAATCEDMANPSCLGPEVLSLGMVAFCLGTVFVIYHNQWLTVNEGLASALFLASLSSSAAISMQMRQSVPLLSTSIIYAVHGWLLVFLDNRLVVCAKLQVLNMATAALIHWRVELTDPSYVHLVYSLPLVLLATVGPLVVKALLEAPYRHMFQQTYGPVMGQEQTVWAALLHLSEDS